MESNVSYENEIEQLKVISENQEKLLKKLEELEKNDTEEEEKLKYIQSNINNLFEIISRSINNNNNSKTTKSRSTSDYKIPINSSFSSSSKNNNNNSSINNTQTIENNNSNVINSNSINIPSHNNNSNTINEILESRETKKLYVDNEFENFIGRIIEAPSSSYRQEIIINEVKKGYIFSIHQIGELLNLLPYFSEKKSIIKIIKNSIHDYYNKQDLLEYLNEEAEEQKQELFNLLFN